MNLICWRRKRASESEGCRWSPRPLVPWPPSHALRFLPSLPLCLCFSFLTFPFLNLYFIFVHFSGKLWSRLFLFIYILMLIFFANENGPFSSMLLYHISYIYVCMYFCICLSLYFFFFLLLLGLTVTFLFSVPLFFLKSKFFNTEMWLWAVGTKPDMTW